MQRSANLQSYSPNMHNNEPKMSYLSQLFVFIGLFIGFAIISSIAALAIWMALTGKGVFTMEKDMLNPAFANASKWTQLVAASIMFFAPAFVFRTITHKKPMQALGFNNKISANQLLIVLGIAVAALFLSGALGTLNEMIPVGAKWAARFKKLEDSYNEQVKVIAKMNNIGEYFFSLIVIALAPAIVEEVFFRGAMQRFLKNWTGNAWFALIFTAVIFSAVHVSFYGFLPRAALGVILGLIFMYSNNIWLNIFSHFLNNGIAVTIMYFATKSGTPINETLDDKVSIKAGVLALAAVIFFLILFKNESNRIGASQIPQGDPKLAFDNDPFLQDFYNNKESNNDTVV